MLPDQPKPVKARALRARLRRIDGYHHHIDRLTLPDRDDRHVVAAALEAKASRILAWNLNDFPVDTLKKLGLVRQTPDGFLAELYDQTPDLLVEWLSNARQNLSKSAVTPQGFLKVLREQRLIQLAKRLTKHIADL